jgi:hypothetical protein
VQERSEVAAEASARDEHVDVREQVVVVDEVRDDDVGLGEARAKHGCLCPCGGGHDDVTGVPECFDGRDDQLGRIGVVDGAL